MLVMFVCDQAGDVFSDQMKLHVCLWSCYIHIYLLVIKWNSMLTCQAGDILLAIKCHFMRARDQAGDYSLWLNATLWLLVIKLEMFACDQNANPCLLVVYPGECVLVTKCSIMFACSRTILLVRRTVFSCDLTNFCWWSWHVCTLLIKICGHDCSFV